MSILGCPPLKSEGTWLDFERGEEITDPAEIAKLEAARDAELAAEEARQKRIRIADETGMVTVAGGRTYTGSIGITHDFLIFDGQGNRVDDRDLHELAEIMIDRWERFKASLEGEA